MTELKVAQAYVAKYVYRGQGESGPYEVLVVQAPGNVQPTIAIKPVGSTGIGINGLFRIDKIISVVHKKRRDKKTGKWYDGNVGVVAKITPLAEVKINPEDNTEIHYAGANPKTVAPQFPSLEDFFK